MTNLCIILVVLHKNVSFVKKSLIGITLNEFLAMKIPLHWTGKKFVHHYIYWKRPKKKMIIDCTNSRKITTFSPFLHFYTTHQQFSIKLFNFSRQITQYKIKERAIKKIFVTYFHQLHYVRRTFSFNFYTFALICWGPTEPNNPII